MHAGRHYLRVPATRQPDRYSLAELAEAITDHQPTRHRPPVIVVEDAAAADPAHLATVATALADAHGRLLLVDNGQPGPARRLLDGMALPWSENTNPTTEIADPRLDAAANTHRAAAQKRWRTLKNPLGHDRGRGRDRDQGHGLDID